MAVEMMDRALAMLTRKAKFHSSSEIASSAPLQMMVYFNSFFSIVYAIFFQQINEYKVGLCADAWTHRL